MRYFPINLDVRDKPVIIVGGGAVAARKCRALLAAEARITVISPTLAPRLQELAQQGRITHLAREFARGDLAGAFLVFAAANSRTVNRAVADEANRRGLLADIVDAPAMGNFTSPAVLARGDLLIAVTTSGKSPALARKIRDELGFRYGPEYAETLVLLGKVREKLLTEKGKSAYNKQIFNSLVAHDLPALLKRKATAEIDHLLLEFVGPGCTLAALGMEKKDSE
jgi:precorrin-2 dehydrogenase/sirohydrochlorin ferrochelatase